MRFSSGADGTQGRDRRVGRSLGANVGPDCYIFPAGNEGSGTLGDWDDTDGLPDERDEVAAESDPASPRSGRTERKRPRKVTARSLENVALFYLKRYTSTVRQLEKVLQRRVRQSFKEHGGDPAEAAEWIRALLDKLVRGGLLSDEAFAENRTYSLRAGGRSTRVIAQKLRLKGVSEALVQKSVAQATAQVPEEDAARHWAKKKRLGPYRRDLSTRDDNRQRDLAALARAGFSYGVCKSVIDASAPEHDA